MFLRFAKVQELETTFKNTASFESNSSQEILPEDGLASMDQIAPRMESLASVRQISESCQSWDPVDLVKLH